MSRWEGVKATLRHLFRPEPWPEVDEDDVSAAARRQFVANSKHPPECAGGCQCRPDRHQPTGGDL